MITGSFVRDGELTLASYADVLMESRSLILLLRSLGIAAGVAGVATLIGVPVALLLERTDVPFRRTIGALCLLPLLIPAYVSAIGWLSVFRGARGVAWCIAILALSYFPIVLIFARAGLRGIGADVEESARLTQPWPFVWLRVTLPLASAHIIGGFVVVFILSLSNFGVPAFLSVNTYPVETLIQFAAFHDISKAAAVSMPLLLVSVFLVMAVGRIMAGKDYIGMGSDATAPDVVALGHNRWAALIAVVAVLAVSVGVPLSGLIVESASAAAFRTAWRTAHGQLFTSVGLAALAATAGVCLCFPLAYLLARGTGGRRSVIDCLTLLPFAVPASVLGIGLIKLWSSLSATGVYGTAAIVIIGYIARFSPVAVRAISASIRQVDPQLEEAARIEQVGWVRRAWRILIPLTRPGLALAWSAVFILSMGELAATMLVVPPGGATISIRIETLMHYGAGQVVAALCLMTIAATLIPVALVIGLLGRPRV